MSTIVAFKPKTLADPSSFSTTTLNNFALIILRTPLQAARLEQSPTNQTKEEAFALLKAVEIAYGSINSRSGPWSEQISESLRKFLENHKVRGETGAPDVYPTRPDGIIFFIYYSFSHLMVVPTL
jgi:hypothetical protein